MEHKKIMQYAIDLAEKGVGKVNPNPLVGAVIVKNEKIIGQGYHKKYGQLHAERNALANCLESADGAIMYVTLEPCCHYGKTPPCTEAIIESGIKKVYVGVLDPNPLVAGKGIEILRNNGVEVIVGLLEEECKKQNEVFFHYIKTNKPYIVMKYAMTLDGKIATYTGESKWVTGHIARENVHKSRNRYSGIMIGVGTALSDNPMLTCRVDNGRNPIRIICDTHLKTPIDSNIMNTAKSVRTIIATSCEDIKKQELYIDAGTEIIYIPALNNKINLNTLVIKLGEMKIDSILLEGGSELNFSALESGVVSKVQCYIAPKLFGGNGAKSPVGGIGFEKIKDCINLKNITMSNIGEDILIESEVINNCLQE